MSDLRALIEAAKADGPSTAARAKVWAGVSTMVGEAATAASGAGGGVATGSAGAVKMLVLGTLLGGSVTVGIGAAVLIVGHVPMRGTTVSVAAPAPADLGSLSRPGLASSPGRSRTVEAARPAPDPGAVADRGAMRAAGDSTRRAAARLSAPDVTTRAAIRASAKAGAGEGDTLAREAQALAEARGALARRDALSALQIVRSLRALPGRQLVPEELAVEAQALRGLGLDDDASAVEARLRVRFPDSVLGR
jgi:hypothetical protein